MSTQTVVNTPPMALHGATVPPLDHNSASQNIPLGKIVPSKTNPGRAFDPESDTDNETLESIRVHGVLQPILLRKPGVKGCSFNTPDKYEIVAGERRYSCATIAGHVSIPAVIRQLTDIQALELQYIENAHRKDLDPMAHAAALRRIWDAYKAEGQDAKACMARMIERTNRKPRTVWNLLSLGNFIKRGEELLRAEKMSMSHAYEICRRAPSEQKQILDFYEEEIMYGGTVSVRDLKEYIRDECDHFVDVAPFDKADAQLVKEAGACIACEKNSAVNPNLVDPEDGAPGSGKKKVKAICTDSICWGKKVQANLVQIEQAAQKEHGRDMVLRLSTENPTPKGAVAEGQWKEVKGGSCKNTFASLIVDGANSGKRLFACASPNLCKTHWGSGAPASTHRAVSRPRSDSEKKAMLQKQRTRKADQAYRTATTAAIRAQVKELKIPDLQEVAIVLFDRLDHRLREPVREAMGWKSGEAKKSIAALKPPELAAFIALVTIADNVLPGVDYVSHSSPIKMDGFALRHKLDLAKIEADATRDLRARWREIDARKKEKGAAQTSAKKTKAKAA